MIALVAQEGLPEWAATPLGWGTIVVVLALVVTGHLRPRREITDKDAQIDHWRALYETEKEARQAAERAAAHVMENGSAFIALVEAFKAAAARSDG